MWTWILTNWHKILVVIIALIHLWKFFFDYVRPAVKHEGKDLIIKVPKEGVVITVKPRPKG